MKHRSRPTYWSGSKLSKYLQARVGIKSPKWASMDEWDIFHEDSRAKAPFTFWFTDVFLDKLQDVWMFIPDLYWSIKTADIWKYFKNLYVFRKCLWNYRSWDYSGMLMFMETSARDMSHCHKHHGHLVKAERTAKDLLIFAELLKRIREDDFQKDKTDFVETGEEGLFGGWEHVQKPNTLPNYRHPKTFYAIEKSVQENHLREAAKIFERKLKSFWD